MSSEDTQTTDLDEAIARIAAEVEQSDQVDRSAELLIGQLAQELRDAAAGAEEAASDPDAPTEEAGSPVLTALITKLNSLADSLDSSQGQLSAAVVANTPASPDATPAPVTQEQVDQAVADGIVTLPTAPAAEGVAEGEPVATEVQPDPPAGTADLGSPSEGNDTDPAFTKPADSATQTVQGDAPDEPSHVAEAEQVDTAADDA